MNRLTSLITIYWVVGIFYNNYDKKNFHTIAINTVYSPHKVKAWILRKIPDSKEIIYVFMGVTDLPYIGTRGGVLP